MVPILTISSKLRQMPVVAVNQLDPRTVQLFDVVANMLIFYQNWEQHKQSSHIFRILHRVIGRIHTRYPVQVSMRTLLTTLSSHNLVQERYSFIRSKTKKPLTIWFSTDWRFSHTGFYFQRIILQFTTASKQVNCLSGNPDAFSDIGKPMFIYWLLFELEIESIGHFIQILDSQVGL